MKPRLFITDLDGTILVDEGEKGCYTPERTARALRALAASGVTVVLASGRMHESIQVIADGLGLKGPIISYNGAMIRMGNGDLLLHHPLDISVAHEVVELAENNDYPLNFYFEGRIYSRRFHPWWDLYEGRTCSPMTEVDSLRPYQGKAPTKLLLMNQPAKIKELEALLKGTHGAKATVLVTADEYLEFMNPLADKGLALRGLAERLGADLADCVACGDGYNDLGMIREVGLGVAVANGRQALKDEADVVVAGPSECGVADFIERELL